jgi:hypothetical protein
MKKLLKDMFSRENLKKAMIYASFTNPRLTSRDYLALNNALREIESTTKQETQMEMKKAA